LQWRAENEGRVGLVGKTHEETAAEMRKCRWPTLNKVAREISKQSRSGKGKKNETNSNPIEWSGVEHSDSLN